jgi:hypothetical protein
MMHHGEEEENNYITPFGEDSGNVLIIRKCWILPKSSITCAVVALWLSTQPTSCAQDASVVGTSNSPSFHHLNSQILIKAN